MTDKKPQQDETADASQLPTVVANRFNVLATPQSVRITFGEKMSPNIPTAFHGAYVLSSTDARWLADLINDLLAQAEGGTGDLPIVKPKKPG